MQEEVDRLLSGEVLAKLRGLADARDRDGEWPGEEIGILRECGALRAAVGKRWGGDGRSALEQHLLYEAIARVSLAVSLILSQRDAAVGLIEVSESSRKDELLQRLAAGEVFATVGIAQLTTSRQGGPPALRGAPLKDGGYRIDGLVPWCTGAARADFVVDEPMPLVALASTMTTSIRCEGVVIRKESVLRVGKQVLSRGNHLPLAQVYLAMGLCRGAIDLISEYRSPVAEKARERFGVQLVRLRDEVIGLSQVGREGEATAAAPAVRGRCNDLALRATHAAVTLYKGTGLLAGHPAQRMAREALFLLVWSCPTPVIDCTVELLSEPPAGACEA